MQLTAGQQAGLDRIMMTDNHIVIAGAAGTGKTFLLRSFLDMAKDSVVLFTAPTHQAKNVLSDMVGEEAHTIHSVLGIHPDTLEDQVTFGQKDIPDLSSVDYLVLDELSMVGSKLGKILLKSITGKCRIIGLGDPYQLQPVVVKNNFGEYDEVEGLSPLFFCGTQQDISSRLGVASHRVFEYVFLNEIMRQSSDNPLIQVATDIRVNGSRVYDCNDGEIGVFKMDAPAGFYSKYLNYVKTPEDTLNNKIVAYTNASVNKINSTLRRKIYNTNEPLVVGEYLVCQAPVMQKIRENGRTKVETIFHNGEIVQVEKILKVQTREFKLNDVPAAPAEIEYYSVRVKSTFTDEEYVLNLIIDDVSYDNYQMYKGYAVEAYRSMKRNDPTKNMKGRWRDYWEFVEYFTDVKGTIACTIHKSQGSTYENVFVLASELNKVPAATRRQLEYVAVTRSKRNVYFR